ncbi:MAG TPA: hypothetical protein VJG30_05080 [Candidatus Nanoarchaeia archaeon]|nr:hypothetical protein [Candidatus Nanoarchaeia archaeon]
MDKNTAQTVVKVLAVLYWIGAVFGAISGLAMLFGSGALGFTSGGLLGGFLGGFAVLMGIVMLVIAALEAYVGWGLWNFKNWAKITAIVLAVIGLLAFPIGTIVGIVVIYLLGFNNDVKSLFH